MYVLSWRTVSALTQVLFLCLFPSLFHNLGNKHKNNSLVTAETVRHSSTYIILNVLNTSVIENDFFVKYKLLTEINIDFTLCGPLFTEQ